MKAILSLQFINEIMHVGVTIKEKFKQANLFLEKLLYIENTEQDSDRIKNVNESKKYLPQEALTAVISFTPPESIIGRYNTTARLSISSPDDIKNAQDKKDQSLRLTCASEEKQQTRQLQPQIASTSYPVKLRPAPAPPVPLRRPPALTVKPKVITIDKEKINTEKCASISSTGPKPGLSQAQLILADKLNIALRDARSANTISSQSWASQNNITDIETEGNSVNIAKSQSLQDISRLLSEVG